MIVDRFRRRPYEKHMKLPDTDPWKPFFETPISGNAKLLGLRLAREPYVEDNIPPRIARDFADELKLTVFELEHAHRELWDPRVAWVTSQHFDRPVMKKDCFVRSLVEQKRGPGRPPRLDSALALATATKGPTQ